VVIVTPYIVDAVNDRHLATPLDGLNIAHDRQTILFGRLHKVYGVAGHAPKGRLPRQRRIHRRVKGRIDMSKHFANRGSFLLRLALPVTAALALGACSSLGDGPL
jgi:Flp pilus assembly secretin CpaC